MSVQEGEGVSVTGHTKQTRRKRADVAALRATITAILKADHPQTVRQVFYQLVVRGAVEKTESEYSSTVSRLLGKMRMSGAVPWEWISDESQELAGHANFRQR